MIREISLANPLWSAPRIHGELLKLGIEVTQTTVAKYMARGRHPPSQSWKTFLRNHAEGIASIDFFVVPTATLRLLFSLVILRHDRRHLVHLAVTSNPTADWITAPRSTSSNQPGKGLKTLCHARDPAGFAFDHRSWHHYARLEGTICEIPVEMDRETDKMKSIPGLRASRALLAAVLDQVGEAIISIGGDQRITMLNKRAEQLFGYSAEEALGMPIGELIPTRFRDSHGRYVGKFMASGKTSRRMGARVEIVGLRRDRSEFPAEAAISRVEFEGRIIATVIIQDITERRQQMEALRESEARLIQAEKVAAIGTMASGIGHEINNPLYAILTRAEAIRDEKETSQCRRHAQEIIKHSKHIAAIVKDLAGYIRPGAEHDLEVVDVNDQLSEAVSMAGHSLLSDHIEIKKNLGPVARVLAKPEEIRQAFFNVIRNGIQAIEGKGVMEIDSWQEGNRVSVRIRDTGPGIPKDHQGKVFDPFFTTKGPDQGQGLGLYIVKQIVEKYEGTISLESQEGVGTVCCLHLPVAEDS